MTQELRGALIALVMACVVFAVAAAIAQPMTIFHGATVRLQTPGGAETDPLSIAAEAFKALDWPGTPKAPES